jgi:hypothetical protein
MGRVKEKPRYNVVSLRVTDEERKILEALTRATRKNMSQVLREAMSLVATPDSVVAAADAKR